MWCHKSRPFNREEEKSFPKHPLLPHKKGPQKRHFPLFFLVVVSRLCILISVKVVVVGGGHIFPVKDRRGFGRIFFFYGKRRCVLVCCTTWNNAYALGKGKMTQFNFLLLLLFWRSNSRLTLVSLFVGKIWVGLWKIFKIHGRSEDCLPRGTCFACMDYGRRER